MVEAARAARHLLYAAPSTTPGSVTDERRRK
jgi:hypothetical protein